MTMLKRNPPLIGLDANSRIISPGSGGLLRVVDGAAPVTFGAVDGTFDTTSYRNKGCVLDVAGGDPLVTSVDFYTSLNQEMEFILAELNGSNQIAAFLVDSGDKRFTANGGETNTVDLTDLPGGGAQLEDGKAYAFFIARGFVPSNMYSNRVEQTDPAWIDPGGLFTVRSGLRVRSNATTLSVGQNVTNSSVWSYTFAITYLA